MPRFAPIAGIKPLPRSGGGPGEGKAPIASTLFLFTSCEEREHCQACGGSDEAIRGRLKPTHSRRVSGPRTAGRRESRCAVSAGRIGDRPLDEPLRFSIVPPPPSTSAMAQKRAWVGGHRRHEHARRPARSTRCQSWVGWSPLRRKSDTLSSRTTPVVQAPRSSGTSPVRTVGEAGTSVARKAAVAAGWPSDGRMPGSYLQAPTM